MNAMKMYRTEADDVMDYADIAPEPALLPCAGTLEGFARETGDGIDLRSLKSGTTLLVNTRNTHYRLVVLNPARLSALIKGGELIQDETEARINGATCGGSTLKGGWIGVGFRMDVWVEGRRIITSPVRSITVEPVQ